MAQRAKHTYAVVCQQAWCNSTGCGIHYNWDGETFRTREAAIQHGFAVRGSDDFNIAVLSGRNLVSFDWMEKPVGESPDALATIAAALGFRLVTQAPDPEEPSPVTAPIGMGE